MRIIANVCALALALTVAQAQGGEDTTAVTPDAGRILQQGERLDVSDSKGNRIGYGHQRPDGSWDVFGMDGSRRGTIQKDTGSGARATTPGKR